MYIPIDTGNSLAIIITGSGKRVAESYNGANSHGDLTLAPRLVIDYTGGGDKVTTCRIYYRANVQAQADSTTSLSVAMPLGTVEGDLMIATVAFGDGGADLSAPGDWTLIEPASPGSEALRTLAPGGRMICYGTLSPDPISLPPRDIMMPMTSVEGFYLAEYLVRRTVFQRIGLVRTTAKLIASGVLGTAVEQTYPLDEIHAALEHARRPGRAGKILLSLR